MESILKRTITYWRRRSRRIIATLFIYFGMSHLYPALKNIWRTWILWLSQNYQFRMKMIAWRNIKIHKLKINTTSHYFRKTWIAASGIHVRKRFGLKPIIRINYWIWIEKTITIRWTCDTVVWTYLRNYANINDVITLYQSADTFIDKEVKSTVLGW